jgi:glycosyltransferase involved in cell wall biosynthesis
MRILHCSSTPVTRRLGSSKVYIEIAEALRELGWDATVVGPEEVAAPGRPGDLFHQPAILRDYLARRAKDFDIVEVEHHQLPFARSLFPRQVLFVARSVLHVQLQARTPIPGVPTLRARVGAALRRNRARASEQRIVENASRTMAAADVINLCNEDELALVRAAGLGDKAMLLPFGLTDARHAELEAAAGEPAPTPVVSFIGTFDPRKGMAELPDIVRTVLATVPGTRFRLLGTGGLVPDVSGVLSFFPRALRASLEVVPRFEPEAAGRLLHGSWLGMFPSHMEGFPFGVLELLAAGLPVVAYRAPGAPMMLTDELLVERGNGVELGRRIAQILSDRVRLAELRGWARRRAGDFRWREVAAATARAYEARLEDLRASSRSGSDRQS